MPPPIHSSRTSARRTSLGARGSLDPGTLLDANLGRYVCTLYPQAGEASIVPRPALGHRPRDPDPGDDEERRQRNEERAVRRARSKVRRHTKANRLRFLWTLTERAEIRDYGESCAHLDGFLRRLREEFGAIPIVAVPEPQPGGHAWHWHFGCDRFLSIERLRKCWPHGFVHVSDGVTLRKRRPPREMARYLVKYIVKSLAEALPEGFTGRQFAEHRYRVTQGFEPDVMRSVCATQGGAYTLLQVIYGEECNGMRFALVDGGDPDCWWLEYDEKYWQPPPKEATHEHQPELAAGRSARRVVATGSPCQRPMVARRRSAARDACRAE